MAFADPQAPSVGGVTTNLYRTRDEATSSSYTNDDGTLTLTISHRKGSGVTTRMVRLDQTKVAEDPISAQNKRVMGSAYIVIVEPDVGFTDTELTTLKDALLSEVALSGNVARLLRGEH